MRTKERKKKNKNYTDLTTTTTTTIARKVLIGSISKKVPLKLLVDLIAEAYDVLPVFLSVCWMGGFI